AKPQMDAAGEFANAAVAAFTVSGRIHPATVVAASARMAGTYLFRSFDLKLPKIDPGQAVLSVAADEQAPLLIEISAGILARAGLTVTPPAADQTEQRANKPVLEFINTQRKLEAA